MAGQLLLHPRGGLSGYNKSCPAMRLTSEGSTFQGYEGKQITLKNHRTATTWDRATVSLGPAAPLLTVGKPPTLEIHGNL